MEALPPAAFGFDLRGERFAPLAQSAPVWHLLTRFRPRLGLDPPYRRAQADEPIARTRVSETLSLHQDFLRIPIGREGAKAAYFALGEAADAYHCLIGGATRSGKSTLLNRLILGACESYSPPPLRLWLFDFREGVEFGIYAGLVGKGPGLYLCLISHWSSKAIQPTRVPPPILC